MPAMPGPYTPPPFKTKSYEGREKITKMVMLKHPKICHEPRSLSFRPNSFKIFIHQGFLNVILNNPFIILW
jgi:hypothetical protein